MYAPLNPAVYLAANQAVAGFYSGELLPSNQSWYAQLADAWAQAVDTAWGAGSYTLLDLSNIASCSVARFATRGTYPAPPATALNFAASAALVVALVRATTAQVVAEGINPNAGAGSGVSSVSGTAPIVSSGGPTPAISITAATDGAAGSMSAADKTKLDGLPGAITLQPGGTAGPSTYTSWAALYAAHGGVPGVTVMCDPTFGAVHMTAGGPYALHEWTFVPAPMINTARGAGLTIDDGATIAPGAIHFLDSLSVSYAGAAPAACMTAGASGGVTAIVDVGLNATLSCSASGSTGAFLSVPSGGAGFINLHDTATLGDGTNAVLIATGPGTVADLDSTVAAGAVLGAGGVVEWNSVPPNAQGAGVAVMQIAGRFSSKIAGTNDGTNATPFRYSIAAVDVHAADHVFTAAEYVNPQLSPFGTLAGDRLLTFPQVQGATWDIELSGMNFNGHTLTFTAGGATRSITAAQLAATGATGCRIGVVNNTFDITRYS